MTRRAFILGTDWFTDCDDVAAVRILCRAHCGGEAKLLGCVLNAAMPYSAASLSAFMHSETVDDVPIGIDRRATGFGGRTPYQEAMAKLPHPVKDNDAADDALALYRRLLAENRGKAELIEIGYPQVLAALLASGGDKFSSLPGIELVREKVSHLWIMAGKWDEPGGRENNFCRNRTASEAAETLCRDWPTPITFLGWEVGASVLSGRTLPPDDLLKQAMAAHGSPDGRCSWDPMLALLALHGDPEKAGYSCVYGTARVDGRDGSNRFDPSPGGRHRFVVKKYDDAVYEKELEQRLSAEGKKTI